MDYSDKEIKEDLDRIIESMPSEETIFVSLVKNNEKFLNKMTVDRRTNSWFYDLGYDLATNGYLLLSIYLMIPTLDGYLLYYLTFDGRSSCFSYKEELKPAECRVKDVELLVAFLEGFLGQFCKKNPLGGFNGKASNIRINNNPIKLGKFT